MSSTIWLAACTLPSKSSFHHWGCDTQRNRNFDLEDVHVEGAERIAEAVAKYDVDRFIHVSSYNADVNSESEFFRTKVGRLTDAVHWTRWSDFTRGKVKLLYAAFSRRPP